MQGRVHFFRVSCTSDFEKSGISFFGFLRDRVFSYFIEFWVVRVAKEISAALGTRDVQIGYPSFQNYPKALFQHFRTIKKERNEKNL